MIRTVLAVLISVLVIGLTFQNCSRGSAGSGVIDLRSEGTKTSGSGNGTGYDGKIYVMADGQNQCDKNEENRTGVLHKIAVTANGIFRLIDKCQVLNPPVEIPASELKVAAKSAEVMVVAGGLFQYQRWPDDLIPNGQIVDLFCVMEDAAIPYQELAYYRNAGRSERDLGDGRTEVTGRGSATLMRRATAGVPASIVQFGGVTETSIVSPDPGGGPVPLWDRVLNAPSVPANEGFKLDGQFLDYKQTRDTVLTMLSGASYKSRCWQIY